MERNVDELSGGLKPVGRVVNPFLYISPWIIVVMAYLAGVVHFLGLRMDLKQKLQEAQSLLTVREHSVRILLDMFGLRRYFREVLGGDSFVGVFRFGGMLPEEAERSMRLFAREVMPELKQVSPAAERLDLAGR